MKSVEFRRNPKQQEHAQLDDDLRPIRAKRLREAAASTDKDPHAVPKKFDELSDTLHRIIDKSDRKFLTPEEEMWHAAKTALLELLDGIESSLTEDSARLLRDDDWVPYLDGIVEESVKMYPTDNFMVPTEFRMEMLDDPKVAEKLQTLRRISAEHSQAPISTVMDEYVKEIRDKTTEAAFLYRSPKEIADDIAGQVEHIAKRIGLNPKNAREEYKGWGEQQAADIMLRRYQHIFDIAFKTAYEQDPELSDPEHLREMVRHTIQREPWEDFDFDAGYEGYIQSDEFFGEYRDRFLKAIRNEPLRNDMEQLLQNQDITAVVHQLAENIEVYMHALPGQKMEQLGFLVGIQFERWYKRQQLPLKMRAFYSDEVDAQQEAELQKLVIEEQAMSRDYREGKGNIRDIEWHDLAIRDLQPGSPQRSLGNVAETLADTDAVISRMFGAGTSIEQLLEDMNTLLKWEGTFDPLIERLTTEAVQLYLDWYDQLDSWYMKSRSRGLERSAFQDDSSPYRVMKVLETSPFFQLNQLLISARGRVVTVECQEGSLGGFVFRKQETSAVTLEDVAGYDYKKNSRGFRREAELVTQAVQGPETGQFPKYVPREMYLFQKYYMEQQTQRAITVLRAGRALPDGLEPEAYLSRCYAQFKEYVEHGYPRRRHIYYSGLRTLCEENIIVKKQKKLMELMYERQQRRAAHDIT